ncbi:hypothetical protein HOV04_gp26 [Xanthomonas phage XcP1]|uniref:Uncharacterized protein n=1 Tax=Xanthomonas phage XcP1 TaxID=2785027 RepID=A0A3S7L8T9_9CAUD|nr:hypothetical protein HOV04_gp26 [Xanthomonas phage XcP1]AWN08528.1 hypothetical protein XcP1_026 [Xanthomonas phage XcP1]
MSTKSTQFTAYGVRYRTKQFTAIQGLEILSKTEKISPVDVLLNTEVQVDGVWLTLSDPFNINEYVKDATLILPAIAVLNGVVDLVRDYNFGFIGDWSGVKVPKRLTEQSSSVSSNHVSPMVSQIIQDGAATMRELEEYYSLQDAFKLFDVMVAKGLSEALANEAASKKVKRR